MRLLRPPPRPMPLSRLPPPPPRLPSMPPPLFTLLVLIVGLVVLPPPRSPSSPPLPPRIPLPLPPFKRQPSKPLHPESLSLLFSLSLGSTTRLPSGRLPCGLLPFGAGCLLPKYPFCPLLCNNLIKWFVMMVNC
mgnify:FL=1